MIIPILTADSKKESQMPHIKIKDLPTQPPKGTDEKKIRKESKDLYKEIGQLHEILVAQKKHSLLVVFQGMDATGKDGSTENVFSRCSPIGLDVKAFKKPTEEEFAHDFLWRIHKEVPAKGEIKIFNRSHYEDVLIQRVHGWIDDETVDHRFEAINAFEKNLVRDNSTTILKFFLNISSERQLEKLQERIDDPEKNYKHNIGDWEQRKHWDTYMKCYEDVLNRSAIPWHPIPVDRRWYRNYAIAKIVLQTLKDMNLELPRISEK